MNKNIYKVIPSTESGDIKGVSKNKEFYSKGFSPKNPEQKDSSLSLTVTRGFTLAETLIVLVILGIIASITIPAVVRRQMEANNRARIKKAMTVYDTAINKFIIENQLKSDAAVYQIAPKNNCTFTSQYFKAVENIEENGNKNLCKFKSTDGVWWDISDILNPIIGLKRNDLTDENSNTSFKLSSKFDQNGSLRVNDLAYETNLNSNDLGALQKIYAFINGEKEETIPNKHSSYSSAKVWQNLINGKYDNECENPKFSEYWPHADQCTNCKGCSITAGANGEFAVFDEEGNLIIDTTNCSGTFATCSSAYVKSYEYDENNNKTDWFIRCNSITPNMSKEDCTLNYNYSSYPPAQGYQVDENGKMVAKYYECTTDSVSSCSKSYQYEYNSKGQQTAIYKCDGVGENCTSAYSINKYDDSTGKLTAEYSNCDMSGTNCTNSTLYEYEDVITTKYQNCNGTNNTNSCSYYISKGENNDYYYYKSTEQYWKTNGYTDGYAYCNAYSDAGIEFCASKGISCTKNTYNECVEWDENWDNCLREEPYTEYHCE